MSCLGKSCVGAAPPQFPGGGTFQIWPSGKFTNWTGTWARVELGLKHGLAVLVVISWLKNPGFTTRN